jgi:nitrate reductase gamma subunit
MTRDQLLFGVAPYLAVLVCVSASVVRFLRSRGQSDPVLPEPLSRAAMLWRAAIAAVVAGHVLAFVFPAGVLLWNRLPLRLYILEGSGLVAGSLALVGLVVMLAGRLRDRDRTSASSPLDVIAGTLILTEVVSGLAIAVLYRWASSWSGVTLAPYLASLVRLQPSIVLVTGMPLLVRLHVFCAFAIVAVLPFTRLARFAVAVLGNVTDWTIAPVASICAPAWRVIETWSAKNAQALQAVSIRGDGEEN